MHTETITWRPPATGLPDSDLTVLVKTEGCEEPVWLGFHDGEGWRDVDGLEISVTAWADLPTGDPDGVMAVELTDAQIEQAALKSGLGEELWFGQFTPKGYEDTLPKLRRFADAIRALGVQVLPGDRP